MYLLYTAIYTHDWTEKFAYSVVHMILLVPCVWLVGCCEKSLWWIPIYNNTSTTEEVLLDTMRNSVDLAESSLNIQFSSQENKGTEQVKSYKTKCVKITWKVSSVFLPWWCKKIIFLIKTLSAILIKWRTKICFVNIAYFFYFASTEQQHCYICVKCL